MASISGVSIRHSRDRPTSGSIDAKSKEHNCPPAAPDQGSDYDYDYDYDDSGGCHYVFHTGSPNPTSNYGIVSSNEDASMPRSHYNEQIERWVNMRERHELIALGHEHSKQQKSDAHEKPQLEEKKGEGEIKEVERREMELNPPNLDLYKTINLRLKTVLRDNPGLAARILYLIRPELHFLSPLFKGDGLSYLLEQDTANEDDQQPGSQSGSSPSANAERPHNGTDQASGRSRRFEKRRQDDDGERDDERPKRSKKQPASASRHSKCGHIKPKLKCIFYAKSYIEHCFKRERQSTNQGFDTFSHMKDHLKDYHTMARCQKCHYPSCNSVEEMESRDEEGNAALIRADDNILNCKMKAELETKIRRFRVWPLREMNGDDPMMNWITNSINTFQQSTGQKLEVVDELGRDLAKWYTYFRTIFPNIQVVPYPFYETNIPSTIQKRHQVQALFTVVARAVAEQRNSLPASLEDLAQLFEDCISIGVNILVGPDGTTNIDADLMERIGLLQIDMDTSFHKQATSPRKSQLITDSPTTSLLETPPHTHPSTTTVDNLDPIVLDPLSPTGEGEDSSLDLTPCAYCNGLGWCPLPI